MTSPFESISERILRSHRDFYAAHAAALGLHQYDGGLSDLSALSIRSRVADVEGQRASPEAVPFGSLSDDDRFDHAVLAANLKRELLDYTELRVHATNPEAMLWHIDPSPYILRNYAPLETRADALANALSQVPRVTRDLATHLATGEAARPVLDAAIDSYQGMAEFYERDIAEAVAELEGTPAYDRVMDQCQLAAKAVDEFVESMRSLAASADGDFAIGADLFAKLLAISEMVDTHLDTLLRVGRQDLARNERRLEAVAKSVDREANVGAVVASAACLHPTADNLLPETADLLEEIRTFISEHYLIGLPTEFRCDVVKTPSFMDWSFAAMDTPGPFETDATESYYYVTPPRDEWTAQQKEEWLTSYSYGILRSMSVHEAYPGHFVQYLHSRAVESSVRKTFWSYAFAEGWAHYVEEVMIEEGFGDQDPFAEIGQLQEALMRNCRLICAIEMHASSMSVDQAARFFMDHAFLEETPAQAEATRGTFDPSYLKYTLGKLMFLELRGENRRLKGDDFFLREFHDRALSFGEPPIPLLRAQMLNRDIEIPFSDARC